MGYLVMGGNFVDLRVAPLKRPGSELQQPSGGVSSFLVSFWLIVQHLLNSLGLRIWRNLRLYPGRLRPSDY